MPAGRCRDIAHVSAVELRTQVPEQIVLDDGTPSAVWYHVAGKSYDRVYTHGTPPAAW